MIVYRLDKEHSNKKLLIDWLKSWLIDKLLFTGWPKPGQGAQQGVQEAAGWAQEEDWQRLKAYQETQEVQRVGFLILSIPSTDLTPNFPPKSTRAHNCSDRAPGMTDLKTKEGTEIKERTTTLRLSVDLRNAPRI